MIVILKKIYKLLFFLLMAAILDSTRKRGFPKGGFGWGLMCCFKYFNRVKLC